MPQDERTPWALTKHLCRKDTRWHEGSALITPRSQDPPTTRAGSGVGLFAIKSLVLQSKTVVFYEKHEFY